MVYGYVLLARWRVAKPTNLIETDNLTQPGLAYTISQLNQISTACRDGFIPFISVDDIADVAFRALTIEKSYNRDFRISGPELLTYDDVSYRLMPCFQIH